MNKPDFSKLKGSRKSSVVLLASLLFLLLAGVGFKKWQDANNETLQTPVQTSEERIQEILAESTLELNQDHPDQAIVLLKKTLSENPGHLDLMLQLGRVCRKSGYFEEAEKVYQETMQRHPNCIECLNNRAVNFIQAGQASEALELLLKAIEKKQGYLEAHLNLGIAYEKVNQTRPAIAAYQKYLQLIPRNDSRPEPAMARERIRRLEEGL